MDIWDKKKRSEVMSKIRSKNTKPEILLRKALFAKGYRYRINDKKLPGKPDIVLPKHRTVIFVHGCFWHSHEGCKYYYIPKSNTDFWIKKFQTNKERDKKNISSILSLDWNIIIVWECTIAYKKDIDPVISRIAQCLADFESCLPANPQLVEIE